MFAFFKDHIVTCDSGFLKFQRDILSTNAKTNIHARQNIWQIQIPMLSRSNWWSESLRLGGPGEPRTLPGVM